MNETSKLPPYSSFEYKKYNYCIFTVYNPIVSVIASEIENRDGLRRKS